MHGNCERKKILQKPRKKADAKKKLEKAKEKTEKKRN